MTNCPPRKGQRRQWRKPEEKDDRPYTPIVEAEAKNIKQG
jgi:hypothetical protein